MVKRGTLVLGIAILAVIVVAFLFFDNEPTETIGTKSIEPNILDSIILDTELKDVATQETFKISDFSNKPILLESFAVWCPFCTLQQKEIRKLHEEIGEDVISISLDTDPNEDEARVLEHINENGFDWRYAISPVSLTQALIDEFGVNIVNAPQAPVVLICNGEEARKLGNGVKSVDELKEEIERGC